MEKIREENLKKSIENKNKGVFFVNCEFNDELLEYLYLDIEAAIKDKNIEEIKIYINSNGGSVTTFFSLYDLLKSTDKKIITTVLGKAYSAGAMLLLSGTERCAYKHSSILLHEVASEFGYKKNSQMKEEAYHLEMINKQLVEIVKNNTKMKEKEISRFFESNKDIFITSSQALKFGIIDKIL